MKRIFRFSYQHSTVLLVVDEESELWSSPESPRRPAVGGDFDLRDPGIVSTRLPPLVAVVCTPRHQRAALLQGSVDVRVVLCSATISF